MPALTAKTRPHMSLGDVRTGKLTENLVGFGRALRRAGLAVDGARIALALDALRLVGVAPRDDVRAALEAVLVSREQDRAVFGEMFDAWFRDPALAQKLLQQMLPGSPDRHTPTMQRPRVREVLAPLRAAQAAATRDQTVELDACMSASQLQRLPTSSMPCRPVNTNGCSACVRPACHCRASARAAPVAPAEARSCTGRA
jgi:hypothetical protein